MNAEFTPNIPESCAECPFIAPYTRSYAILAHQAAILTRRRDELSAYIPTSRIDERLALLEQKKSAHETLLAKLALKTTGCRGVQRDSVLVGEDFLVDRHCSSILMNNADK